MEHNLTKIILSIFRISQLFRKQLNIFWSGSKEDDAFKEFQRFSIGKHIDKFK